MNLLDLYTHNAGITRARDQYRVLPIAAIALDWCTECCFPRKERRCRVCRGVMRMRGKRGAA